MQLSWESSSELRGRPFFTEAQPLTNSVGPVWRRGASSRAGCVGSCFLVDMFEESCNEPSWLRGSAGTMACDFGLRRGTKPPCARAVTRSARWRGAPVDAPPGGLGGVARRSACSFFVGCRLARGWRGAAPPPASIREPTPLDADLCLRLLGVGLPMGCCTPVGFKFLPPLASLTFFSSCRKR